MVGTVLLGAICILTNWLFVCSCMAAMKQAPRAAHRCQIVERKLGQQYLIEVERRCLR